MHTSWRHLLAALVLAAGVLPAQAISRVDSQSMTCARVQALLQREGAAILRYTARSGAPRYDRFVASGRFCQAGEYAANAWAPTKDEPECFVQRCRSMSYSGGRS